ncbi:MAG: rod shape-determining protein MreC [Clostridiales bacterium]|nr:rod shape-determining protein MreC [Clostridiales bacterium]
MARKTSRNKSIIIVTIIAVILIAVIIFTGTKREEMTAVERWIGNIITPVNNIMYNISQMTGQGLYSIFNFNKIANENELLKKEIELLEKEIIQIKLDRDELEELRGLKFALNYIEEDEDFIPIAANITAKSSSNWFDIFTIDVGENQGVTKDSIILASNGLVGRVYDVGGNWSKVVSIIDSNSSVSFQVLRNKSYQGIISGSITNELKGYLFDPNAEVVMGDKLITSGLGMYPKGIMIGEVIEVSKSSDQLLKTVTVEPAVNFQRLNKVLVISPNTK